jgi:cytochrome o ubiquinol oxidase subunit 3
VAIMVVMLAVTHAGAEGGYNLSALVHGVQHSVVASIALGVSSAVLIALSRSSWAVDFGEANAIDVEGMGLYWHFVDIVWIIIFTVVYLLEYL